MWTIELTVQAERDLAGLDRQIAARIVAKLESVAADPQRFFSKLVGYDLYKLRVGDYRVIALLSTSQRAVIIQRIEHRSNVYQRRR
jgi:mRNA interferase RelE/StbE